MTIKDLKDQIKDLPDDMMVVKLEDKYSEYFDWAFFCVEKAYAKNGRISLRNDKGNNPIEVFMVRR